MFKGWQKNKSKFKNVFFALTALFSIFVVAHVIFLFFLIVKLNVVNIFLSFYSESTIKGINVLVYGIDDTRYVQRSDSLVVVHLNSDKKYIGALSIPRDTRVSIEGHGMSRINHAYAFGGVDLLKQTVSNFLAIPIDYYVQVEVSNVKKLVDAIGGVTLRVEKAMNYTDFAGDLYIDIQPGVQTLNGDQAVQYLRFRQDNEGDIGRIQRQQYFLQELSQQLVSFESILRLPKIIRSALSIIKTDLKYSDMISLVQEFKDVAVNKKIQKSMVPGAISLIGGASYWKPDIVKLDQLVDDVLLGFDVSKKLNRFDDLKHIDRSYSKNNTTKMVTSLTEKYQQTESDQAVLMNQSSIQDSDQRDRVPDLEVEILAYDNVFDQPKNEDKIIMSSSLSDEFDQDILVNDFDKVDTLQQQDRAVLADMDTVKVDSLEQTKTNVNHKVDSDKVKDSDSLNLEVDQVVVTNQSDSQLGLVSVLNPPDVVLPVVDSTVDMDVDLALINEQINLDQYYDESVQHIVVNDVANDATLVNDQFLLQTDTLSVEILDESIMDLSADIEVSEPTMTKSDVEMVAEEIQPAVQNNARRYITQAEIDSVLDQYSAIEDFNFKAIKCEVLNGVGVNGIANNAAILLKSFGIIVPNCDNAGNFDYKETIIIDWHGNIKRAVMLAKLLKIDPMNIILYDNKTKPLEVSLVLGKDWLNKKNTLVSLYNE